MKMEIQRPSGFKLQRLPADIRIRQDGSASRFAWRPASILKLLAWALAAAGAFYLISQANPLVVAAAGIGLAAVLAAATAVCIHAMNNTRL